MTCLSCKASIENALKNFEAINHLVVDFERKELVIKSKETLTLKTIQKLLPKKYKILESDFSENSIVKEFENKSKIQQLKPLLLIIFYITSASVLLHFKNLFSSNIVFHLACLFRGASTC